MCEQICVGRTAQEQGWKRDDIAEVIRENRRCPKNLQTDGERILQRWYAENLENHDVNHYSMLKASVIERFNCTLKNDMWKMFMLNGNYKVDELPCQITTRKRRTIGMWLDVISAIAERILGHSVQRDKVRRFYKIQSRRYAWANTRRFLKRVIRQIGPSRCLRSLRSQRINPVFIRGLSRKIR